MISVVVIVMPDYKRMYFRLFAACADAVEALEAGRFDEARGILILAQRQGEEAYMSGGDILRLDGGEGP